MRTVIRWKMRRRRGGSIRLNRHWARQQAGGWKSWYIGILFLALGLGGGVEYGWTILSHYAEHHAYFAVNEIVISVDDERVSREEVQSWSGLRSGMNMWDVDPFRIKTRLLAHPWIRAVEVRQELPRRIYVEVSTRRPVAIIRRDVLTYLDATGRWLPGRGQAKFSDLPYVSGLDKTSLETATAHKVLASVLRILAATRDWKESLSEIQWDKRQGYTCFLAKRRVTIRLGWELAAVKFIQLQTVLENWPVDGPAAVFDARFADQVVVRPYAVDPTARGATLPV